LARDYKRLAQNNKLRLLKSPISPHRLACGFNVVPQRSSWDFIVASERRKVIAVVDDDPLVRKAMDGLISSLGYRAELHASAAEFIAAALTTEVSCLLLDVQLGAMTGIELARHLISTGFSFPTVFMTGSRNESYQRDCVALGCVDYLHKPFPASRLICAIGKALGPLFS
jgi:FixJ family two-component response regulator